MKKYIVKENGETVGVFLNAGQACALNDEYMKYGRSCTIDIVTEPDETETNEQEEETMKNYDYLNAVCDDVREYIANEIDRFDWTGDRDGLEEKLNDDLFVEDSVTGNASGSYYCNAYRAKEAFMNDPKAEEYFAECCADFGMDAAEVGKHFIRGDYEYFDVTIRCYLLGQAIAEVLDGLEETGYFDNDETDES